MGANPTISGGTSDVLTTVRGPSYQCLLGYKTDGFLTQEDIDNGYARYDSRMTLGDLKYIDTNKDGKIDAEDMTEIGDEFPRLPLLYLVMRHGKILIFLYVSRSDGCSNPCFRCACRRW